MHKYIIYINVTYFIINKKKIELYNDNQIDGYNLVKSLALFDFNILY